MNIDISNFSNYLYKKIGIDIDNNNVHYLENFLKDKKDLTEKNVLNTNLLKKSSDYLISREQLQPLINKLTINETYFFRDKNHIDFISKFIEKNISGKGMVIWSMGCSSGEEPYTIALILKDKGMLEPTSIPIKIYGFDINTNFLDIAKKANYSSWSFRGMEEKYNKYFDLISDDNYIIKADIKEKVNFVHFNIKEDLFQDNLTDIYGVPDIILCRNTLMYFNRTKIKKVISRFSEIISDKGCIISGSQELNLFKSDDLQLEQINNTFIFTKPKSEKNTVPKYSKNIRIISAHNIALNTSFNKSPNWSPVGINSSAEPSTHTEFGNPDAPQKDFHWTQASRIIPNKQQKNKFKENVYLSPFVKNESHSKESKIKEVLNTTGQNTVKSNRDISGKQHLKSTNSDSLLSKALELTNNCEYTDALKLCDKILAYDKNEYIAYYIKSFIYFLTDNIDKAFDNIESSLLLKPNSALFHYSYSNILIKKEFCPKVIYHLKKAAAFIENEDIRLLKITGMNKNELKDCINIALSDLEGVNE